MPIYQPDHVEYAINTGRIKIALEDGTNLPAYWAHPSIGEVFPGVVLLHDWWGITDVERSLANLFGQMGYYVIIPDLYDGKVATTPAEAMTYIKQLDSGRGYRFADTALHVLEKHHRSNRNVAAVGLGMGGSLAFEAAIKRADLEAAVCYYGFPQRFFGHYAESNTPILAFYGTREPHVRAEEIERLRQDFSRAPLPHEVVTVEGAARDFFTTGHDPATQAYSKFVLTRTLAFLEKYLEQAKRPPAKKAF